MNLNSATLRCTANTNIALNYVNLVLLLRGTFKSLLSVHLTNEDQRQVDADLQTKPTDLVACYHLHSPSLFGLNG